MASRASISGSEGDLHVHSSTDEGRAKVKRKKSGPRTGVACGRCRRRRHKCINEGGGLPCEKCVRESKEGECVYPRRGEGHDRHFRVKRVSGDQDDRVPIPSTSRTAQPLWGSQAPPPRVPPQQELAEQGILLGGLQYPGPGEEEILPPVADVEEALGVLIRGYLQLSFFPQALFVEQLKSDITSISSFLLLAILAASARHVPNLVRRFGTADAASKFYSDHVRKRMVDEMLKVSLQGCQAFFLLSVNEWGGYSGEESAMLMGIAVRMAGLLALHKESTYALPEDASPQEVIQAEVARRTFWLIACHEDLTSGRSRPLSFTLSEITVLLPCDEDDFNFGVPPPSRASLKGTQPALLDPESINLPSRSFFATLLQVHRTWGKVARMACDHGSGGGTESWQPWAEGSAFRELDQELEDWERNLPPKHRWNPQNLRGMRAQGLDLAFMAVKVIHIMSCVVLRRTFLTNMASTLDPDHRRESFEESVEAPEGYWETLAREMIQSAVELLSVVEEFAKVRSPSQGFAPILVFAVYLCGTLFTYLWRWPKFCPEYAAIAQPQLRNCLNILLEVRHLWPIAARYVDALEKGASVQGDPQSFRAAAMEEQCRDKMNGLYRHDDPERLADFPSRTPSATSTASPSLLANTLSPPRDHLAPAKHKQAFPAGHHRPTVTPAPEGISEWLQQLPIDAPSTSSSFKDINVSMGEYDPLQASAGLPPLMMQHQVQGLGMQDLTFGGNFEAELQAFYNSGPLNFDAFSGTGGTFLLDGEGEGVRGLDWI